MGNMMDNPLTEERLKRVTEITEAILLKFGTEFPGQFKNALIKKIKADNQPEEVDSRLLQDAPVPDWDLMTGDLEKQGGSFKNWKPRFFRAFNQDKNYKIEYYIAENGAKKGEVNCCGYNCHRFTAEEAAEHGSEFGLKLVPNKDIRRTWFFKCPDEEKRTEWKRVLDFACRKAQPPQDEDIVVHEAFVNTLRIVRWHYNYWSWYRSEGTEAESLGFFASDVLDRELINQVISEIPGGPAQSATARLVRSTVNTTVVSLVGAAWNLAVSSSKGVRAAIESAAKAVLDPLLQAEVELKRQVVDTVGAVVNPFMEKVGAKFCQPLFRVCAKDITAAYVSLIGEWHAYMQKRLSEGAIDTEAKFNSTLRYAHAYADYSNVGPMYKTNNGLSAIGNSDVTEIVGAISGGFSGHSLMCDSRDSLLDLCHRGLSTFETTVRARESVDYTNLDAIYADIASKLVHDAKLSEKALLVSVLTAIIQGEVDEKVIIPCKELVAPIQDVISKIPVPGVPELISLPDMVEEVVNSIVFNALFALTEGASGDIVRKIQDAGDAAGIAPI